MLIDWMFFIGLILGGIIGWLSSFYLWIVQRNYRRRNVASALKTDILKLNERIRPLAYLEKIQQVRLFGGDEAPFILPFYRENDLFEIVKSSIFEFDSPLGEMIVEFYKNAVDAEKYRQMLILNHEPKFDNELLRCLSTIEQLTWKINPLLEKEISWNIFLPHYLSRFFQK